MAQTDSTQQSDLHVPSNPIRVVTAASLFDGHDAAINIMRRILQAPGRRGDPPRPQPLGRRGRRRRRPGGRRTASRSAPTRAGTSSTSSTWSTLLRERGAGHVRVYGGGGGVDRAGARSSYLHSIGVARIFSPEDGQQLGLAGMVNTIIRPSATRDLATRRRSTVDGLFAGDAAALAHARSPLIETGRRRPAEPRAQSGRGLARRVRSSASPAPAARASPRSPTSWSAASASTSEDKLRDRRARGRPDPAQGRRRAARRPHPDELPRRRPRLLPLAGHPRRAAPRCPSALADVIAACKAAGFDLVIVETPGIGQGDAADRRRSSTSRST